MGMVGSVSEELANANLGDSRLSRRLERIVDAAVERPEAGYPQMMGDEASLEGLYRFVNNRRVTPGAVLAPHFEATAERSSDLDVALVLHDSTEFAFKRECPPDDMGYLKNGGRGFLGHFSMAADPSRNGLPLGLVAFESLNRTGPRKGRRPHKQILEDPTRESLRWLRGATSARACIPDGIDLVHVADREADFYELFHHIIELGDDFVIRVQNNRHTTIEGETEIIRLFDAIDTFNCVLKREVPLSLRGRRHTPSQKRFHPQRNARVAELEVVCGPVQIHRPDTGSKDWPEHLELWVVHVFEPKPPDGEPGVDWKLLTTIAGPTADEVARIVDIYRWRWLIEEYFKALKTGCAFTKRQFDSMPALLNSLATLAPVAWQLLLLRDFGRQHAELPATVALTEIELKVLRELGRRPLPPAPSLQDAMWAVAALGGHLKRNGPPGWQTLARGLADLALITRGWRAARGGERCDQS
jgi:hypothetical protein